MRDHMRAHHSTKNFKCKFCGKVRFILFYQYYVLPYISINKVYQQNNKIFQYIQLRSLSAKISGKNTWMVCTSKRLQLFVLCVTKPTAGILQEISFLICYPEKAICQTTSTPVTMVGSGRQHVCTSAPAAANLTPVTASRITRRWTR